MSFLGILSLDTSFERIVGDAGNPESYPFPAIVRVVDGAVPSLIVSDSAPDSVLTKRFVRAAQDLEREGASAIVSTCGFLVHIQQEVAQVVSVPVMVSALSLVPLAHSVTASRIGILTADRNALGLETLKAAGIDPNCVVVKGLEAEQCFANVFLKSDREKHELKVDAVEASCLKVVRKMIADSPDLGAIVLECANLPPYASVIEKETGLPVYSILDGARFMMGKYFT